ncbi:aspartic protease [Aphelenchoides avenae]|nr:aspartic protease [Aphelenchus avenae]
MALPTVIDISVSKVVTGDVLQPVPTQFTTTVQIGTPPQELTVLLDYNSAILWVPDATCGKDACAAYCKESAWCNFLCPTKCCDKQVAPNHSTGSCGDRKKFTSSQSSTYVKNGTTFEDEIITPIVDGFIGVDSVTLGNGKTLEVQATFGQAEDATFDSSMKFDGVFGLSLARDAPKGAESPLITAYRRGLIAQPIWTLWLTQMSNQQPGKSVGQITYGAVDTTHCDSKVDYFDVEPYREYDFLLPLSSVNLGSSTATSSDSRPFAADLDITRQEPGATRSFGGNFSVPCNANVKPLVLEFARGLKYKIPRDELVIQEREGDFNCILNLRADSAFEATSPQFFVVGAPLSRQYCTVHDIQHKRYGLTKNYAA